MYTFADPFSSGAEPDPTYWSEEVGSIALVQPAGDITFSGSTAQFNWLQTKVAAHPDLADVLVGIKISVFTGMDGGPMARVSGTGTTPTCYYWDLVDTATSGNLYRRVNGVDTLVSTTAVGGATVDTNEWYYMAVSGSGAAVTFTLTYSLNGVTRFDVSAFTDTNAARLVNPGRTGICSWNGSTRLTDFLVEYEPRTNYPYFPVNQFFG